MFQINALILSYKVLELGITSMKGINMFLKRFLLIAFVASVPAFAQELTSNLTITVQDSGGNNVAGASVDVTYDPTNSTTTRTTDGSGRASLGGLRPGGPYTVSVSSALGSSERSDISLVVGDTTKVNLVIQSGDIEDVVTVAERLSSFGQDVGLSTVVTSDDVEKYSSVTRDIKDFVRLNPFVVLNDEGDEQDAALSIAGSGNRTNDIKVDGASYNDDFGLNANGYPGQNNPITLESIDQINVRVAPVSVEYSNFEGGVIEVVSKGGTNEFKGSIFAYDRGDSYVGNKTNGEKYSPEFDDTSEGFSLGGPIIQDKVFFFVAYEENEKTTPITWGPAGAGAPRSQNITLDQVNQIRADTISVYGFDPLVYTSQNTSVQENTTLRLDIYLNDDHRLQVNYRETDSGALRGSNRSSSSYYFPSNEYLKPEVTEAEGLLLVSNWTDSFSTELMYNSKTTETGQSSPIGNNTANFRINNAFNMNSIYLGVDPFRSANELETTAEHLKFKGNLLTGNHSITFGYEEKTWDVYNVFIAYQDGSYEFDSYADFLAKSPSDYDASNSRVGTELGGAAAFDYTIKSLFIQDEIAVNDNLDVTFGLRNEQFDGSAPPKNSAFEQEFGFQNSGFDADIDDLTTWRFGLDYSFDNGDALKAVFGTYSTRFPLVWVSNAYSNNGVQTASFRATATCDPTQFPSQVSSTQDQCVKDVIANASLRDAAIVSLAPNFTWPESKVFNLTYETTIADWFVQASYLKKEYDQPAYRAININLPLVDGYPQIPTATAPDGRPIYNMTSDRTYKVALYNIPGSKSDSWTLSGTKYFNDGDGVFSIGYSNQDGSEVNNSPSTTPNSSYGRNQNVDPNNPQASGRGAYITEHRLFANLKSTHYFFGADKPTTFGLFFERRSGYGISPTFDTYTGSPRYYETQSFGIEDDLNDDSANFLMYIPTSIADPKVCWVSCSNPDLEFGAEAMKLLKDLGLMKYAGGIADKGSIDTPWVTSLDLKITQVLPGFRKDDTFVITLGIQNLLNLIDDEKGEYVSATYTRARAIFDLEMTDKVGDSYQKYILKKGYNYYNDQVYKSFPMSTWRAQLGFKYNFSF